MIGGVGVGFGIRSLYDLRSKTNSVRLSPAITPCPPRPPPLPLRGRLLSMACVTLRSLDLPPRSVILRNSLFPIAPPPSISAAFTSTPNLERGPVLDRARKGGSDPVGQSVSVFLSDHFRFGHSSTSNPLFFSSPPSFNSPSLSLSLSLVIFEGRFASNDGMGATQCSQSVISLRFRVGTARIDSKA